MANEAKRHKGKRKFKPGHDLEQKNLDLATTLLTETSEKLNSLNLQLAENEKLITAGNLKITKNGEVLFAKVKNILEGGEQIELLNPAPPGSEAFSFTHPHPVSNNLKFAVRVRLDRKGKENTLSSVAFSGRVPTSHYSGNQGSHIVSNALFYRALNKILDFQPIDEDTIKKLKKFTREIPNPPNNLYYREIAVIGGDTQITTRQYYVKVKEDVLDRLDLLLKRSEPQLYLNNFKDNEQDNQQNNFKRAVRQRATLLRTDLQYILSNIVRFWNKRTNTVWDEKKEEEEKKEEKKKKEKKKKEEKEEEKEEEKGSTKGVDKKKYGTELKGGPAEKQAFANLQENVDIYKSIADLIDIRPETAVEDKTPENITKYKNIRDEAIKEALRLCRYAYPTLAKSFGNKNLVKVIKAIEKSKTWQK